MAAGRAGYRGGADGRADLTCRGLALLAGSAHLTSSDEVESPASPTDLGVLDGELAMLAGRLRDQLRYGEVEVGKVLADISSTLAEVHTVRYEIADFMLQERVRRLEALDLGLAELRRAQDPD